MNLVILAAGMGSRFGGLKQIEKITENGEFIIDFSIYDAIASGFNKVIFIIKEENYNDFKNTIGKRIENKIKVEYVFQNNDNLPKWVNVPVSRIKPFGTAQALLFAKDKVDSEFLIINADDYYGRDAFIEASDFIKNNKNKWGNICYDIGETLSTNGEVKRGICTIKDDYLISLEECVVNYKNDKIIAKPLNSNKSYVLLPTRKVSVNLFIFTKEIFNILETEMELFFKNNKDNLETCEFILTDVINKILKQDNKKIKVINTNSKYFGMTYKEDLIDCKNKIKKYIEEKVYPNNMWDL